MWINRLKWLLLATVVGPVPAYAQGVIEEITVTARKREENLQVVPVAVQAFGAIQVERNRIENLADIAKFTPSLVFDKGFLPQDTRPQIRGLPATRGRPPVAILVDGIDVSTESATTGGGGNLINLRLLDLERVEVVKGPQSALFGRTAFGGAINYVTKAPPEEFEGRVSAQIAEDDDYDIRAGIGGPLVEDTLFFRVNAAYANFDGFYKNTVTGNTIGGYETKGASVAMRARATEDFTIDARYTYSDDTTEPRAQYHLGSINGGGTQARLPANLVGQRLGANPSVAATVALPPREVRRFGQIQISSDPRTNNEDYLGATLKVHLANLRAEYETDAFTINFWGGYTHAKSRNYQDIDFYGLPPRAVTLPAPGGIAEPLPRAFESDLRHTTKQKSAELRIGNLDREGFRWAAGGMYWREDFDLSAGSNLTLLLNPAASAGLNTKLTGNPQQRGTLIRDTTHYSVYGVLEYDITSRLTASAEARYSWEDFFNRFAPPIQISGPGTVPVFSVFGGPTTVTATASDKLFAPRFTLDYKLSDDVLIYASVARGLKPGGYNTTGFTTNPSLVKVNAEKLWSYEIGAKTELFDRRIQLNTAAFYMDYKGKVLQTLVEDPLNTLGVTTAAVNAAAARIYGIEIDALFRLTEQMALQVSYTGLDTKYTNFRNRTNSLVEIGWAGNCTLVQVRGQQLCEIDFSGRRLERIPAHSATATLTFRQPLTESFDLILEASGTAQSDRYDDEGNFTRLRPYALFDLKATVEAESWSVTLFVDNVLNDKTITSGQGFTDTFIAPTPGRAYGAFAADPRQIGLRAAFNF